MVSAGAPWADRGRFGNKETRYDFGVFDGEGNAGAALVGIAEDRAVAFLVLYPKTELCSTSWAEWEARAPFNWETVKPPKLGCTFLWVLPSTRGSGAAQALADAAVDYTGATKETFPWLPPFTESGERFVRKYAPNQFRCCA